MGAVDMFPSSDRTVLNEHQVGLYPDRSAGDTLRGRLEAGVDDSWAFQQALCRRAPGCSESRTEMFFGG